MTSEISLKDLYQEHREQFIRLLVFRYNLDMEDAKDIYQNSIIVVYENICAGKFESRSSIKTYLFAICKNKALAHKNSRANKMTVLNELDIALEEGSENVEEDELKLRAVRESIMQMGDKCKSILTNYYYYRQSMEQIAIVCGFKNAATATNEKYKCLMKLKSVFQTVYKN